MWPRRRVRSASRASASAEAERWGVSSVSAWWMVREVREEVREGVEEVEWWWGEVGWDGVVEDGSLDGGVMTSLNMAVAAAGGRCSWECSAHSGSGKRQCARCVTHGCGWCEAC